MILQDIIWKLCIILLRKNKTKIKNTIVKLNMLKLNVSHVMLLFTHWIGVYFIIIFPQVYMLLVFNLLATVINVSGWRSTKYARKCHWNNIGAIFGEI